VLNLRKVKYKFPDYNLLFKKDIRGCRWFLVFNNFIVW